MSESEKNDQLIKYLIITQQDAAIIAGVFLHLSDGATSGGEFARIAKRMRDDTGADIQDIVDQLKGIGMCAACVFEGQERYCQSPHAHKLGRRLRRLLERARGDRFLNDTQEAT